DRALEFRASRGARAPHAARTEGVGAALRSRAAWAVLGRRLGALVDGARGFAPPPDRARARGGRMIHVPGKFEAPVPRLIESLKARGHEVSETESPASGAGATLLLARPVDWMRLGVLFGSWHVARGARILVLSRVGAHPDARAESLRDLWRL